MLKQWRIIEKLHPQLVQHLLETRGLKETKEKERFLFPDYENHLIDPFEIKGMEELVGRFVQAIDKKEMIGILSDYDADGVCSAALFSDFFRAIGYKKYFIHIPDRNKDGYGLSLDFVLEAKEKGVSLLFTLDSGVSNFEEIKKASEMGIDVIVVDHHEPPPILPSALVIVDPKQKDETSPFIYFCTAGLLFKIICALLKKRNFGLPIGWEKWLLDLVAVATIADMVPMVNENRILVHYGLKVLRRNRRPGLNALLQSKRLWASNLSEDDVSFSIAPSINLAGRMTHAKESLDLLLSPSVEEAKEIISRLNTLSLDRKKAVSTIIDSLDKELGEGNKKNLIVSGHPDWHPGVLGLAANKMVEKYGGIVFLWGQGAGDNAKGSCRSDGGVDLVSLMQAMPENFLSEFGGHKLAGGFSLSLEKTKNLKKVIEKTYKAFKNQESEKSIFADAELVLDDVNWLNYEKIRKLSPFGKENVKPMFVFRDIIIEEIKIFGVGREHIKLVLNNSKGEEITAVSFFSGSHLWGVKEKIKKGEKIDLLASFDIENYRGAKNLILRIVDVK